jgi:hypothetical protein
VIAKVQPSKRKSKSSFKRLLDYLTKERDPDTGNTLLRGDVVLSNNLVGIDTAAAEMKALGFFNPRCNDAVVHYELAWPPGERPTRVPTPASKIPATPPHTLPQARHEQRPNPKPREKAITVAGNAPRKKRGERKFYGCFCRVKSSNQNGRKQAKSHGS